MAHWVLTSTFLQPAATAAMHWQPEECTNWQHAAEVRWCQKASSVVKGLMGCQLTSHILQLQMTGVNSPFFSTCMRPSWSVLCLAKQCFSYMVACHLVLHSFVCILNIIIGFMTAAMVKNPYNLVFLHSRIFYIYNLDSIFWFGLGTCQNSDNLLCSHHIP